MLNAVSVRLSSLLLKRIDNAKYSQDVYTYGIEILLSTMAGIIAVLISAFLCSSLCEGIIFLVLFSSLRIFTGGYHANTYGKCLIVTVGSFWVVLVSTVFLSNLGLINYLYIPLVCSGVYIIAHAPIENEWQPLNHVKMVKNGKRASIILFIHLCAIHLLLCSDERKKGVAILTIGMVAVYMLIADKNKRGGNEDENHCKNG